jgi:hypothetical protein
LHASPPAVPAIAIAAVALAVLAAPAAANPEPDAPRPPKTVTIDFGQDDGALDQYTGPPPDIQHPSLIQGKYRGIPDGAAGPPIDDPLAGSSVPSGGRRHWLGLRLAGGMFEDSAAAARAGLEVGLAGRYRLTERLFAAGRADWSRRGGDAMTGPIDVLGVDAGLGATVAGGASGSVALALIGQLRGEVRLADQRDGAPVRRAGLGISAAAELALPSTPFSVGVRAEQGLTELVAGARDRAVLVELGVDLR